MINAAQTTANPGAAAAKPQPGAAARRRMERVFTKPTPRTMALGAILLCFAASGALRFGEVWRRGDLENLFEQSAAESVASDKGARNGAAEGAAKGANTPGALENAEDMEEALAAMEAALAAGEYATASTPQKDDHGGDGKHGAGDKHSYGAPLPPVGSPQAGKAADLISALKKREAELDAYAAKLAERNEALTLAAERLDTRIKELEASREQFEVLVATVDQAASRDVAHLIKMYEKMKPKEAGPLFDSMDPSFAAGFLSRMKPDAASAIMAKMSTGAAYAVSLQLAGRNVRKTPGAKRLAPSAANAPKAKK